MEEKTVFLKHSGYKVPFKVVKQGVRAVTLNNKPALEERLILQASTDIGFKPNQTYIFEDNYEKSFNILEKFVHNNTLFYIIGRLITDIIDAEEKK